MSRRGGGNELGRGRDPEAGADLHRGRSPQHPRVGGSREDRMTSEVANILLNAKDDMTGVEIALVAVIRDLQQRVEELKRVLEERSELGTRSAFTATGHERTKAKEKLTMNEVVKFPINTPVEVTLQNETGKRVDGRYGNQVMYSLIDDRVMYVPLYVEQRLKDLAIGASEPLLLSKQEVKEGDRKRVEWSVKRAPQQPHGSANGTAAVDSVVPETTPGLSRVGCGRENELGARNGEGPSTEQQTVTL